MTPRIPDPPDSSCMGCVALVLVWAVVFTAATFFCWILAGSQGVGG